MRDRLETAKQFRSMSRAARADALVGRYLCLFAFLEVAVNRALANFLGSNVISWTVVSRNMGFAEKAKSIRAIGSALGDVAPFSAIYKELISHAEVRNIIAHSTFWPSEVSDGVTFMGVRATGQIAVVEDDWSVDKMMIEYQRLRATSKSLADYSNSATPLYHKAIADAQMAINGSPE